MTRPIIKSFESVDRLYKRGINICKGCAREYCGSCNKEHFCICNAQAKKHSNEIINN